MVNLLVFVTVILSFYAPESAYAASCRPGFFGGNPVTEWRPDGRTMSLTRPIAYIDSNCEKWIAPVGAITDGATIPERLWSIVGGPYEGTYRNAAIIHDWYCDMRLRKSERVHHMFFEAMLASGVKPGLATIMFGAVSKGGPEWDEQTKQNSMLSSRHFRHDQNFLRLLENDVTRRTIKGVKNGVSAAGLIPSAQEKKLNRP